MPHHVRSFRVVHAFAEHKALKCLKADGKKSREELNVPWAAEAASYHFVHLARAMENPDFIITTRKASAAMWGFTKRKLGKNILRPDGGFRNKLTTAKLNAGKMSARDGEFHGLFSVSVSACGNFGFVGCDDGVIITGTTCSRAFTEEHFPRTPRRP